MDITEIIERLRVRFGVKSDAALARRLGIPQRTVSNWRTRKAISAGAAMRIASRVGPALESLLAAGDTKHPISPVALEMHALFQVGEAAKRLTAQAQRLVTLAGEVPFDAIVAAEQVLRYIKDATPEELQTMVRLVEGLRASPEVRTHLIGQLKLIERLIEAEQPPREDEAADPPPRA